MIKIILVYPGRQGAVTGPGEHLQNPEAVNMMIRMIQLEEALIDPSTRNSRDIQALTSIQVEGYLAGITENGR